MNIGERIKILRNNLGLTLDEFGEKIGLKKATLSKIENNLSGSTEQTIILICKEYNVNREWLLNGVGEMFNNDDTLKSLIENISSCADSDIKKRFLKAVAKLTPEQWELVEKLVDDIAQKNEEPEKTIEELEEEYKKALGFAPSTNSSALNTTDEKEA
jgi:transcriptional regulator with XRE-family HTH domain